MKSSIALVTLALVLCCSSASWADTFGSGANAFEIEFVTIGNPGNPADTTGVPNPAGSVPNSYRLGKYEISRETVSKANAAGNLGLTLYLEDPNSEGVQPTWPAVVTWNEAARFVNWLNTSQGYLAAYKFSTQPGDPGDFAKSNILLWESGDVGHNPANPFRNSMARYFLPSADEWYKAAYYDPNAGIYYDYPTGSDTQPTSVTGGTAPATAVYNTGSIFYGPADVKNAGGLSPYGLMGMGGNVYEYEETELDLGNDDVAAARGARGGSWYNGTVLGLLSSLRESVVPSPSHIDLDLGFRVASVVPEPSTLLLGTWGCAVALVRRKRNLPIATS